MSTEPWIAPAKRQIAAAAQATRQRAIARNARHRIRFIRSPAAYTVERDDAGAWVTDVPPQPLPRGASLGPVTPGDPIFDTRGMLAADVSVPVAVAGGGTKSVTINVLGRTTIN